MSTKAFVTMTGGTLGGGQPARRTLLQEVVAELSKPENRNVIARVNESTGDVQTFIAPQPYFAKQDAVMQGRHVVVDDGGDDEEGYVAPVNYFDEARRQTTADNGLEEFAQRKAAVREAPPGVVKDANRSLPSSAHADPLGDRIDEMLTSVLELTRDVNRSAEGSPERARAEADLVHAKHNLRTALRYAESQLREELATAKPARAAEIEDELSAIRSALEAVEPDQPALSKNSEAEDDESDEAIVPVRGYWET